MILLNETYKPNRLQCLLRGADLYDEFTADQ